MIEIFIEPHQKFGQPPIEPNEPNPITVKLLPIGGNVEEPTFSGIGDGNQRLVDAKKLVEACTNYIKTTVIGTRFPGIFFIYRGVAIGGLQHGLGGFASKPLTVKEKSIDPAIIQGNDDFNRLTGLVPIQKKLGKKGKEDDPSCIALTNQEGAYRIVKTDTSSGNVKSYLCCGNTDRQFSWENTMNPNGKTLCTFLGNTSCPYLADWDLVLVGVTKQSIRQDKIGVFNVVKHQEAGSNMYQIIPQWLLDCIKAQQIPIYTHVTQHGPESLYCGNDITQQNEQFIVLTHPNASRSGLDKVTHEVINRESKMSEETPWSLVQKYVQNTFVQQYFLYQFEEFNGKENKPNSFDQAIHTVNQKLLRG
ncbi:hypothetical protein PN466_18055 [Roseofilum reptotaenium CS-1145]|uniref:Uncharacterized protein n=1 Tax=Roseofilum reptotaenium AO1-A TaxID=1925591 RepID=A0A1L9QSR9_9CYAN|nr:hypothetical protein [Roseofilum reptotaenium]MDB9518853.1 hypothetical protein [Roseofilum reptotaenium CS-1145]OJJ25713.1 hypothetical protein BI308_10360 [Roseofilum reptotaenium AO1-A]